MPDRRKEFGNAGEETAAAYLERQGLAVIGVQQRTRFGELDLVCLQGDEVVFVEVKTRQSNAFGYPEESVTAEKAGKLARSGEAWLQAKHWEDRPWRIDVVAVEVQADGSAKVTHFPAIDMPERNW